MRKYFLFFLIILSMNSGAQNWQVRSVDGEMLLLVNMESNGSLHYSLNYKGRVVVKPSTLGIRFKEPAISLDQFQLVNFDTSYFDQEWAPVWGEYAAIRDRHKELRLPV